MPGPTETEVLNALDAACYGFNWPAIGFMDFYHISSRLSAYRDADRWAVVFNSIHYHDGNIEARVEPIGNCVSIPVSAELREINESAYKIMLEQPHMKRAMDMATLEGMVDHWRSLGLLGKLAAMLTRFWPKDIEVMDPVEAMRRSKQANVEYMAKGIESVSFYYGEDDGDSRITVRGKPVALSQLDVRPRPDLHEEYAFWVAVAVVEKYRDQIFARDDEIARFFPKGLPSRLLALDEWCHPEIDVAPSNTETFALLAKAIATGDARVFRPTEKPNTHWENWFQG